MTDLLTPTRPLNAQIWDREADEHYVEPEWCSRRLFEDEGFVGCVDDPCCGFGTIPKAAQAARLQVTASDLVDRGSGLRCFETADFLASTWCRDNIVCNPPFNIAARFALHAVAMAGRKVAIIFPTARLNAAHWVKAAPLARVWLMTPRPSMPPGHIIARGEKPGGGKMDFCWLVFDRDHTGAPELRWLRRDVKGA